MASTILSPKASDSALQPTLTAANRPAGRDAALAHERHRVRRLAFQQPADHVADQRSQRGQDDEQHHRVATVDLLRADEVGGVGHGSAQRDLGYLALGLGHAEEFHGAEAQRRRRQHRREALPARCYRR